MTIAPEPSAIAPETSTPDVIDQLAGIAPGSPLAELRAQRPEAVRYAQGSYLALLEPANPAGLSAYERAAMALRVAALTPSAAAVAWYRARLRRLGADEAALAAVEGRGAGAVLPPRQAALLRHAERLTLAPHAAAPVHIAELKAAGLSARDIVTAAQLIAFVTFQVRVAAGLRALQEGA